MPDHSSAKRVFLAHQNALVRQGVGIFIDKEPDLQVCGESGDVSAALEAVREESPDAVVIDLVSPRGIDLHAIREIREASSRTRILVVTMQDEEVYGERAIRAGASGYVMRPRGIEEVIDALHAVLEGRIYLSDTMADRYHARRGMRSDPFVEDPIRRLSNRELEIFYLLGSWKSTREIAGLLQLSLKTVEYYREQIKRKLGLENSAALLRSATEWVKGGAGKNLPGNPRMTPRKQA